MPCNGGSYFNTQYRYIEDTKRIDHLTRLLCHACDLLKGAEVDMGRELGEWHYEHELEDEARKAEAKRRAEAEDSLVRRMKYLSEVKRRVVGQLTPDELEALGLGGGNA